MKFTPRIYQNLIFWHVVKYARCAIWAGMGLGKTSAVLWVLDALSLVEKVYPALVIAPLRVAQSTWPDEVAKWDEFQHMKIKPIAGSAIQRAEILKRLNHDIYTINYENLPWLVEFYGEAWPFITVVSDECTRLKGFRLKQGTKRAKALARVAHTKVKRFIELSGTPAPNGLQDLWAQIWFIDAGVRLGRSFKAFTDRWFRSHRIGDSAFAVKLEPLEFAQSAIEDRLRDVCLSLNAADYFDLEEPIENIILVDLPREARRQYDEMERRLYFEIEGRSIEAVNAAAKSQKCLQLASGAVYLDPEIEEDAPYEAPKQKEWVEVHDLKMQALEEIFEEAAGMPVLVAYHFRSTRERLIKHFPRGKLLDKNPQTIRDWNAGKIPYLFAHPASCGHGLNLQDGGNIVAHIDHDWNLENFQQIEQRIGPVRQLQAGHNRPVFNHYIIARNTTDEVVMASRKSKASVQELLLESIKRRIEI